MAGLFDQLLSQYAQVQAATADPYNRPSIPTLPGPPGTTSSTVTAGFTDKDGNQVLIPTVYEGGFHGFPEALQQYQKTGEHFGKFKTIEDANRYVKEYLHPRQEAHLQLQKALHTDPVLEEESTYEELLRSIAANGR